jgi:Fe-S oxidoreductase
MDDRTLFRFKPGYRQLPLDSTLDWSEWGSFASAVEMCNNNGACRKSDPGVMCPSYRATGDEQHLTRGRANTLRLALSGQLGPDALVSEAMHETMALCVSCKGCKRECPTGVDMARMKIEFLHHYKQRHGLTARDRVIAYLPRYAPYASRLAPLLNLRNRMPALAAIGERFLGLSARRQLPEWSSAPYRGAEQQQIPLRPSGGRGRGPSQSDGRVRWVVAGALESPTSPQPSPPPGAERERDGK